VVLRFALFKWLKYPIDAGKTFRGRRLFGDSKTWRGVVVAVVGSITTVVVQRYVIAGAVGPIALVDYRTVNPFLFGAFLGGGAMLGELPNSFVKRRRGIAPGATASDSWRVLFYLWDQVDLLTGAWPLLCWWIRPTPMHVLASFALALVIHPTVSLIGFAIGARKTAR
jgi:hypothetical protein